MVIYINFGNTKTTNYLYSSRKKYKSNMFTKFGVNYYYYFFARQILLVGNDIVDFVVIFLCICLFGLLAPISPKKERFELARERRTQGFVTASFCNDLVHTAPSLFLSMVIDVLLGVMETNVLASVTLVVQHRFQMSFLVLIQVNQVRSSTMHASFKY